LYFVPIYLGLLSCANCFIPFLYMYQRLSHGDVQEWWH
jgi:hypothetical protein